MRAVANISFLFGDEGAFVIPRIKAAAAAGFRYIECDWPADAANAQEFKKALDEVHVHASLINCYQGNTRQGECGFAAEPGREDQFKSSLRKTVEYALAIGCKKIHILSGSIIGDPNNQEATLIYNLKSSIDYLTRKGITALIEPINCHSKPGYFLNNYPTAIRVVRAVNSPYVRLQLDLFHLQMISGNITNTIRDVMPLVGHVQVAQSPHRHEPSCKGEVNFQYVFNILKEAGYDGDVGCEYKPSGSTADSLKWIAQYGLRF